jgi:hypothetical protein
VRLFLLLAAMACAGWGPAWAQDDDPDYPHGAFEGDCSLCHGDEGWTPPVIDPDFRRNQHPFPLRRAHDLPDCRACHTTLDFTLASPECVNCHMDPHRGEFGIDCARCHIPRTFIDRSRMRRAHHQTRFPLRGSHRAVDCEDCHRLTAPGQLQYVHTPTECVACHREDYLGASDPDHTAAGFPTECDLCHAPGIWEQARFNQHQMFFPIYSGEHRNRWDACSTCHVVPGDFDKFSCLGCHPHDDETDTEGEHDGVLGFRYDSDACYACHPRGKAP